MPREVFRTCTLCEAICGLKFEVEQDQVLSVAPDDHDVFSRGYVCPKGLSLVELHNDPDRVRTPLRRTAGGDFESITWQAAFELAGERLLDIRRRHGNDAVAVYFGNPVVHNEGALLLRAAVLKALGTRNSYSAGSQDTSPRFASSYYLYGNSLAVPVPDIDRTDYFLCLGANPRISNGSMLTAPNLRERFAGLRARGGRMVVIDPRRTETAREADEHISLLPGSDAALLLAMVQTLVADGVVDRTRLEQAASGWSEIVSRLPRFTPETVAGFCGVEAATIRRLAREFAAAQRPVAYSRVGVCNSEHGTLASYATDLLNLTAGRLGEVGGAMFTTPAFDPTPVLKLTASDGHNRWRSRVRGLPETLGDLPSAALAEEIETAGPGQVRSLVTYAGNPVLSTPNGRRLAAALPGLEFMLSIDMYVNETTRHAHLILPPAGNLSEGHVDMLATQFAARNVAHWSPPAVAKPADSKHDAEILLELCYRLGGGPTGIGWLDPWYRLGRKLGLHWRPESSLDLLLRIGPHGDKFLPWRAGLNRRRLQAQPHGVDLGPLEPGISRRILHRDRKMHLSAPPLMAGIDNLASAIAAPREADALLLIGRRELRTCNSWLHNLPSMVAGRERCLLLVHPADLARAQIADGQWAWLESRVFGGAVRVQATTDMRPGVVSLPHGWGHAAAANWQRTAGARPGVSANDWTDDQHVEALVGQSILNGVPVRLAACAPGDTQVAADARDAVASLAPAAGG